MAVRGPPPATSFVRWAYGLRSALTLETNETQAGIRASQASVCGGAPTRIQVSRRRRRERKRRFCATASEGGQHSREGTAAAPPGAAGCRRFQIDGGRIRVLVCPFENLAQQRVRVRRRRTAVDQLAEDRHRAVGPFESVQLKGVGVRVALSVWAERTRLLCKRQRFEKLSVSQEHRQVVGDHRGCRIDRPGPPSVHSWPRRQPYADSAQAPVRQRRCRAGKDRWRPGCRRLARERLGSRPSWPSRGPESSPR